MEFTPEQLAEARELIRRKSAAFKTRHHDREDLESDALMHLLAQPGRYSDHGQGYWIQTIKNAMTSVVRTQGAAKRGASRTQPIGQIDPPAPAGDFTLTPEEVNERVAGLPEPVRAYAMLRASMGHEAARSALGLSRREADKLRDQLAAALR